MSALDEIVEYLGKYLDCPVRLQAPRNPPATLVTVEQTGAYSENPVQLELSIDCDCWAPTPPEARELAARARQALVFAPERLLNVFHSEITAEYQNDLDGRPRWTVSTSLQTCQ